VQLEINLTCPNEVAEIFHANRMHSWSVVDFPAATSVYYDCDLQEFLGGSSSFSSKRGRILIEKLSLHPRFCHGRSTPIHRDPLVRHAKDPNHVETTQIRDKASPTGAQGWSDQQAARRQVLRVRAGLRRRGSRWRGWCCRSSLPRPGSWPTEGLSLFQAVSIFSRR